jgi:alkanesulfonate monooxygenase
MGEYLWYIPNTVEPGHRGDDTHDGWGSIEHSTDLARTAEAHGWGGALLGSGWGRPDTFTVATAIAARTTTFKPLIAVRPGHWHPAQFASAAATLDQLSRGRVLVNIVSGNDQSAAYGDVLTDPAKRYARTREFMELVRRLWLEEDVTHRGEHYSIEHSTVVPHPYADDEAGHPMLYFGGASKAAEQVSAVEADVQLFWGEPLAALAERIDRLRALSRSLGRRHAPLEFGLRITTLVRDSTDGAWRDAEAKVQSLAADGSEPRWARDQRAAVGQQRLLDLVDRGAVLDSCLYTAPGNAGAGGAASTWLVGSADDVASALQKYRDLGIGHFILSDTPYKSESVRMGEELLPRLRDLARSSDH